VLSHGLPADMSGWPLYRGGYPLLVTPVYWLTHDPKSIYRGVLVVNAVLNAVVFPLTYLFARRVSRVSRSVAFPLAFAVALLPGVVFYSEFALSDAVLPVVVMGWLLCVGLWLQEDGRSRSRSGFAAAVLAAYTDAVHARGAVFVAVFAALLLVAYWRRWDERRRIAQIAGIFVVAVVAVMWFNSWTASQNWPRGAFDLSIGLVAHLTSWHGLGRTALVSIGELWALSVSTLGFGIVAVVAPWRRRAWRDAGGPRRADRQRAARLPRRRQTIAQVVIDLDATLVTAHSDKEGARGNFKGGFGYHPLGAWLDNSNEALAALLRPGNAGSNTAADHLTVVDWALSQLPDRWRSKPILMRADGAGYSHALIAALSEQGLQFSVGYPVTGAVRDVISKMPAWAWQVACNADGDLREHADVIEITDVLDLSRWAKTCPDMRVVVRRELPHPGATLDAFEIRDGYRYQAFTTNTRTGQLAFLEARHRAHARRCCQPCNRAWLSYLADLSLAEDDHDWQALHLCKTPAAGNGALHRPTGRRRALTSQPARRLAG